MIRKPVTDSGEVERKEEKKSNFFWPVGTAILLALIFAGIVSLVLPYLQPVSSGGMGDIGVQSQQLGPQVPAAPATVVPINSIKTEWFTVANEAKTFSVNEVDMSIKVYTNIIVTTNKLTPKSVDMTIYIKGNGGTEEAVTVHVRKGTGGGIFEAPAYIRKNPSEWKWRAEIN
jgi:hypothetical protein